MNLPVMEAAEQSHELSLMLLIIKKLLGEDINAEK